MILEWDRRIEQNAYRYNFEEFTLSSGLPGVILLLLEMEDLDRTYKFKIDQYCDYLYRKLSKYGLLTGSLYSGAAVIALSLLPLKKDLRFQNLIASLNDYISYYVDKEIGEFNIENVTPPNYDVIEGLSGIFMYLLLIDNIDIKLVTKIIIFLLTLLDDNDSLIAMYIKTGN